MSVAETGAFVLIGIGGAHMDRIARLVAPHRPGTSNPAAIRETVGGGVFNALRAASKRGIGSAAIVSARGGDTAATAVAAAIEAAGLGDLSGSFLDRATPGYTAILDEAGELVTAISDMALYETGLARHVRRKPIRDAIAAADAVLIDANLATKSLERICADAKGAVFAMAISAAKANRLKPVAQAIGMGFMNRHELGALAGFDAAPADQAEHLIAAGFASVIVTDGPHAVLIADDHGARAIAPPDITVKDVTGAGDALAGATIAAHLRDASTGLDAAVCEGIAAAALTVEAHGPIAPQLDGQSFDAICRDLLARHAIAP